MWEGKIRIDPLPTGLDPPLFTDRTAGAVSGLFVVSELGVLTENHTAALWNQVKLPQKLSQVTPSRAGPANSAVSVAATPLITLNSAAAVDRHGRWPRPKKCRSVSSQSGAVKDY